ncbi:MAG: HPF/RaiA family ribosome-associated protein [Thiotrichales bacterium]
MQNPLQITFHNLDRSEAVDNAIRDQVADLEKLFDPIISCRVVVESPHKHQQQGKLYDVKINVVVPDSEIVVSKSHHDKHAHEDIYVALRDAFNAAAKQLASYADKRRGDVKNHQTMSPPSE